MYLNALGQPIIVINSLKVASELLETTVYSDRPHLIVANEILCGNMFTALMSYGDVLVFPFSNKFRNLSSLLVGGVALAAPHMKSSPK